MIHKYKLPQRLVAWFCLFLMVVTSVFPVQASDGVDEITEKKQIIFIEGGNRNLAADVQATNPTDYAQHKWVDNFDDVEPYLQENNGLNKAVVICIGINDIDKDLTAKIYIVGYEDKEVPDYGYKKDDDGNYVTDTDGNKVLEQTGTHIEKVPIYGTLPEYYNYIYSPYVEKWTQTKAKIYWVCQWATKTEESDKKVQKWNSAMSPHVPSGCTWMDIYQPIVNAIPDYGDGYKGNKASKYFASDRCLRPDMNMVVFHTIVNNVIFGDPPKDPPEDIDTSMYSVSASLTAYMNKILGPAADSDEKQYTLAEANTNVGKAGAFLGYGDKDYDFQSFITTQISGSTVSVDYNSLLGLEGSGSNNMYAYGRYGYLLKDLGLDDVGVDSTLPSARLIPGCLIYGMYMLSSAVPYLFKTLLTILQKLNPFQFLASATQISDDMKASMGADAGGMSLAAANVADVIGQFYDGMSEIGWEATIPLLIGLLFFQIFVIRKNSGRKIQTVLFRISFLAIGIPMLGSLYTSALNSMDNMADDTQSAPTQMIAATFVDFEGWAKNLRLNPVVKDAGNADTTLTLTSSVNGVNSGGEASDASVKNLRQTTVLINQAVGSIDKNAANVFLGSAKESYNKWDSQIMTGQEDDSVDNARKQCLNLLNRYLTASMYRASDWEGDVGSYFQGLPINIIGRQQGNDEKDFDADYYQKNTMYQMFNDTATLDGWDGRSVEDNLKIFNGEYWRPTSDDKYQDKDPSAFNIFSNGTLQVASGVPNKDSDITYTSSSVPSGNGTNVAVKGGLSTISLYNYLSSNFTESSVVTYSEQKSSSQYVKPAHYSVNLIGTGVLRVLYMLNCMALLAITVVIGLGYGLNMVISNVKRGFSMLVQIPTAMIGVLKSIVYVVTTVLLMICEIIITFAMYSVVSELMMLLLSVIESPIEDVVGSSIIGGVFGQIGIHMTGWETSVGAFTVRMGIGVGVLIFVLLFFVVKQKAIMRIYNFVWSVLYRVFFKEILDAEKVKILVPVPVMMTKETA